MVPCLTGCVPVPLRPPPVKAKTVITVGDTVGVSPVMACDPTGSVHAFVC